MKFPEPIPWTEVIHVSQAPPLYQEHTDYVYIGRPSRWGNPFMIGVDGDRDTVIDKYETYLRSQLQIDLDGSLWTALADLCGKRLVCYCAPLRCHGDVLAHYAESAYLSGSL